MSNIEPESPDLMLAAEVCSRLRISLRTLNRWVRRGRITVLRPGGPGTTRKFPRADVEALARGEEVKL